MSRILIVDDEAPNLYLLRVLLQGHGHAVDEVRNGAAALAAARRSPPDLVISDLLMPVLDGYALLREWKEDERLKSIPFIVYTATYTDPRDERLALDLGADLFLVKPTEPEALIAHIGAALAKAEHGDPAAEPLPATDKAILLEARTESLVRKLEKKAQQLEFANRGLLEEIADRKRAEDKLRESEERFRELAETIQEVFWMTDPAKGEMLYVSPAYEKIWGRTRESLYESPHSWLESVHPEDLGRLERAVGDRLVGGDYDETYRIRRPDGAVRWIRDRAYPVRDPEGRVVRSVGTAEDITERRRLEEQFRKAQKMEAVGRLAAGIAHDFNNIMAVILGNADLATVLADSGRPIRKNLDEIKKAGARAKSMVQQILTFSRQRPQEREVIDLAASIRETVSFLSAVIPSDIEIAVATDPLAPAVFADPTQAHQLIANLCTNAWQALEDKPGRIEVRLQAVELDAGQAARLGGIRAGRAARLTVTDTGKGIDAGALEHIFDPFFTTKPPGKGTGLGLAVVQGIVQEHDGAITVASRPGEGATFHVYFPAAEPGTRETGPPAERLRGAGQRILFLDDEEPLVFLATAMLESLGYRVSGFIQAAEALSAFRADPGGFDFAITDMNMPGSSGFHVAAELLKMRPDLPIALCSGHVTEELRRRAEGAGIREVFNKPGTMDEFGEAIHRLVSGISRS